MRTRAQCIVYSENRVLMVRLRYSQDGHEFWILPGGATEDGETPAEAAIRELKEECRVDGAIVRETTIVVRSPDMTYHTFLVDIGGQTPSTGYDPEEKDPHLIDVKWLTLSELSERDRTYLWEAGLLGVGKFRKEASSWGDRISYPQYEQ